MQFDKADELARGEFVRGAEVREEGEGEEVGGWEAAVGTFGRRWGSGVEA